MDLKEIIESRRSVRNFSSDAIEPEKLEQILEAGRMAPSTQNRQPWRYILYTDNAKIRQLAKHCGLIGLSNFFIKDAPVLIVACADTKANLRVNSQDYYLVDTAISFQQMILMAWSLGIASCWMAAFSEKKLRSYLDIPKHWRIVALSPFGYPAEKKGTYAKLVSSFSKSTQRLPLEEIVIRR